MAILANQKLAKSRSELDCKLAVLGCEVVNLIGRHVMNERLLKQRAVTEGLLLEAAMHVRESGELEDLDEFIRRNELGLALDALADEGKGHKVGADYWKLLQKAADIMGRQEQAKFFQGNFQLVRQNAVQLGVQAGRPEEAGPSA